VLQDIKRKRKKGSSVKLEQVEWSGGYCFELATLKLSQILNSNTTAQHKKHHNKELHHKQLAHIIYFNQTNTSFHSAFTSRLVTGTLTQSTE
jgi:hypothetical protein